MGVLFRTLSYRIKWLRNKGYDYRDAVNGVDGVRLFESDGHFE